MQSNNVTVNVQNEPFRFYLNSTLTLQNTSAVTATFGRLYMADHISPSSTFVTNSVQFIYESSSVF